MTMYPHLGALPTPSVFNLHGESFGYYDSRPDSASEGPVLVLVHGITGSAWTWRPIFEQLAHDHRVIAVDLIGHGTSSRYRGDHSIGAQAAAIRDLLQHLNIDSATFVGHSLGGGIVLQLTYLFPDLVDGLILVSSGGLGRDVSPLLRAAALPVSDALMPALFWGWPRAFDVAGQILTKHSSFFSDVDFKETSNALMMLSEKAGRAAFLSTLRSVVDYKGQYVSAVSRLHRVAECPVLIIWGENDPIIPARHGAEAAELLPGATLQIIGTGHFPYRSDPGKFTQAVQEFTARRNEQLGH